MAVTTAPKTIQKVLSKLAPKSGGVFSGGLLYSPGTAVNSSTRASIAAFLQRAFLGYAPGDSGIVVSRASSATFLRTS